MPRHFPPYRTMREKVHAHVGRAAVIIGGGASMAQSLPKCPTDALYISVNDHGVRYLKDHPELGRACTYIVACDKIEERARLDVGLTGMTGRDGRPWNLPVMGRHPWSDYRLLFMPGPSSSIAAAWCARLMGCAPVILVGMDLYSGPTYVDAPKAYSTGFTEPPYKHLDRWVQFARRYPHQYMAIECHPELQAHFRHIPDAKPDAPVPAVELLSELQAVRVKIIRDAVIDQRPFAPGDEVIEVSRKEAENLARERRALLA